MKNKIAALLSALLVCSLPVSASELTDSVKKDYDEYLGELWDHFHRNPFGIDHGLLAAHSWSC